MKNDLWGCRWAKRGPMKPAAESPASFLSSEGKRRIKTKDEIEVIIKDETMKGHDDKDERYRNVPISACSQSPKNKALADAGVELFLRT
jgi:hypothetical protein